MITELNSRIIPPGPAGTLPVPTGFPLSALSTEPQENLQAVGGREEIRETTRRVVGSRQSARKPERSGERRQPKRGHGSQHPSAD